MNDRLRILLVDDDVPARKAITSFIARLGDEVDGAADGVEALERLETHPYDLVLSDVRMPRLDGLSLAERIRVRNPDAVVVLMSAFATIENVIAALRSGVYDYLLKPVEPQHLQAMLGRVRERRGLRRRVRALTDAISARDALAGLVAGGPAMTSVLDAARRASACDLSVLIAGEPGTGKELLGQAIHGMSDRASGPFEQYDASVAPAEAEAALFGAEGSHGGLWARAQGGTLMIAEVTALNAAAQSRLARAVEAGGVRVVATAGEDLEQHRRDGRFRSDLFYSLRAIEIRMPPLRERREDIPRLVEHFLNDEAQRRGRRLRMAPDAVALLMGVPWPGNVRELESVVRAAAAQVESGEVVQLDHLPAPLRSAAPKVSTLAGQIEAYERTVIRQALEALEGQVARAAKALGIPERTLRRKMRHFGLAKEAFRKRRRPGSRSSVPGERASQPGERPSQV